MRYSYIYDKIELACKYCILYDFFLVQFYYFLLFTIQPKSFIRPWIPASISADADPNTRETNWIRIWEKSDPASE